jgi:glutathione S-transferase
VWIALLAKGVPFDKHEIDLRDSSGMAPTSTLAQQAAWV